MAADVPKWFSGISNIGILLGEPSHGLVDVDLDCEPAIRAAAVILPQTATFGRHSKPASHYLYAAPGTKTARYVDPVSKKTLLERRSTGMQTVFPGSQHPSGERVRWDNECEPVAITVADLSRITGQLAASVLLGTHWPAEGSRNEAALALSGALLRARMSASDAERVIEGVAIAARDEEVASRVNVVVATKAKLATGEPVTGLPRLRELIEPKVIKKAFEWLGLDDRDGGNSRKRITSSETPTEAFDEVLAAGKFYRTHERAFFVRNAGGDAVDIRTKKFEALVARICRLSKTKLRDLVSALNDHAMATAELVSVQFLSAVDSSGDVLVHVGGGVVVRSAGGSYEKVANGVNGILFGEERNLAPLAAEGLIKRAASIRPGDFTAFRRVVLDRLPPSGGLLTEDEHEAIVLSCFLGIFIRPWARGRPILLFVGPAGCGKSVLQRLLAKLFFGADGDTAGGTTLDRIMKDISAAAVHLALVVRDDVNDLAAGAIDVLCRLATGTRFEVALFNETLSLGSYEGRGLLVLSAYAPSWIKRADLMSRFLVVQFSKPPATAVTERQRIADVLSAREEVWAETLAALTLLKQPLEEHPAVGRFDDFERALAPILAAAGLGNAFRSAMLKMPTVTAHLAAEADPLLGVLLAIAQDPLFNGKWVTAAELADRIAMSMGVSQGRDPHRAAGLTRDPTKLGQLLAKVEREGGAVVLVEKRTGHGNTKLWRLSPRVLPPIVELEPRTDAIDPATAESAGGDGGDFGRSLFQEVEEGLFLSVGSGASANDGAGSSESPPSPPSPPRVFDLE